MKLQEAEPNRQEGVWKELGERRLVQWQKVTARVRATGNATSEGTAGLVWVPRDAAGACWALRKVAGVPVLYGYMGSLTVGVEGWGRWRDNQFKVPAQPRSKASPYLSAGMTVNRPDFG